MNEMTFSSELEQWQSDNENSFRLLRSSFLEMFDHINGYLKNAQKEAAVDMAWRMGKDIRHDWMSKSKCYNFLIDTGFRYVSHTRWLDMQTLAPRPNSFIVFCDEDLSNAYSDEEIEAVFRKSDTARTAAHHLANDKFSVSRTDDITFVIYHIPAQKTITIATDTDDLPTASEQRKDSVRVLPYLLAFLSLIFVLGVFIWLIRDTTKPPVFPTANSLHKHLETNAAASTIPSAVIADTAKHPPRTDTSIAKNIPNVNVKEAFDSHNKIAAQNKTVVPKNNTPKEYIGFGYQAPANPKQALLQQRVIWQQRLNNLIEERQNQGETDRIIDGVRVQNEKSLAEQIHTCEKVLATIDDKLEALY